MEELEALGETVEEGTPLSWRFALSMARDIAQNSLSVEEFQGLMARMTDLVSIEVLTFFALH